ncbi:hypothetical protein [Novosphingobium album (ex Liu et al. 2023)]|uniref:hypothetical protein n=1 Tax=Novosphingobium album (ex Liu et al. 2023) TaxID=3031130 RepID=UPI0023B1A28F|nr:hypothetical protein [Novosphingobium album (ex Liu et al. 2023)]
MIGSRELLEEAGGVIEGVGREARMEMLDEFEIAAPSGKCQVSRADEQMGIVIGEQRADLRVEHAVAGAGDGLDLIIAPHPACPFLAEARANTFRIGKDQRIAATAPQQGIKQHRLEEGERQRIGCKGRALPRRGRNQIERIHTHPLAAQA